MKVYTHYFRDSATGIECRWRTILQLGDSWNSIGCVYMKNPGSSIYQETDGDGSPVAITHAITLSHLRAFTHETDNDVWYEFRADSTMYAIEALFKEYAAYHRQPAEGIIQVFNLFNVRDADLRKAQGKLIDSLHEKTFTIDEDVQCLKGPVYIGWGNLWKDKLHKLNAEKVLAACKTLCNYIDTSNIEKNIYYHPQYLMLYGKNKEEVIRHKQYFFENRILVEK